MRERLRLALVPPVVLTVAGLFLYGVINATQGHLLVAWIP